MAKGKVTAGRDALGKFAPQFAELNDDGLFGEVWAREEDLSARDRSVVTVTALLAEGIFDDSFQFHLKKAKENGVKLLLPTDTLAATEFAPDAESRVVPTGAIPADMEGMDIGPDTTAAFCEAVKGAGTVVWNGPMGVFEFERFAQGTRAMAQALADSGAVTIVGGGDSAAAVEQMGFADKITHISTGGGASLEFLEGIELPGVACLLDK